MAICRRHPEKREREREREREGGKQSFGAEPSAKHTNTDTVYRLRNSKQEGTCIIKVAQWGIQKSLLYGILLVPLTH